MSKILSMQLSNKSIKPIFTTITPANKQIKCLLDTGADMPVWCGSEGLLKIVFPKVELMDKKFLLGGFGRKAEMVDIYKIPKFFIRNGEDVLTFQNLYIASSFDRNFGCDLILSATMFSRMDYSILNRLDSSSRLRIEYDRDVYYTQMILNQQRTEVVERIFSFASETEEIRNDNI